MSVLGRVIGDESRSDEKDWMRLGVEMRVEVSMARVRRREAAESD